MLVMQAVQEGIVRDAGMGAVLDPEFLVFAVPLLLAIGLVLYLAVRAVDPPGTGKDGDA